MPVTQVNKPVFQSSDGTQFDNEADAILRQVEIDMGGLIDEYVDELDLKERGKMVRYSIIMEWEKAKALSG